MPNAAARLSAPPRRTTELAEPLEVVASRAAQLEDRVARLTASAQATRSTFLALRSQAVTLSS